MAYSSLMRFERRELEAGAPRVGIELQRPGADDGAIGHDLGGLEIALDAGVLHELHVAEVREALTANRVARGVDADGDIDAGQVANRVGVFTARQPADGHAPWIAGVLGLVRFQRRAHPPRR